MELEGTIHRIMPVVKGQSAKGEWSKQEVVIEMASEMNRKVCLSFWGDRVQDAVRLREGDNLSVSVNIESREYNGRWFTEIRVWKINRQAADNQPKAQPAPVREVPPIDASNFESPASSSSDTDDLPF